MTPAVPAAPVSVVVRATGAGAVVRDEPRSFAVEAVRSLAAAGGLHEIEIIVAHDAAMPAEVVSALLELPGLDLVLVPLPHGTSRAAALNHGALRASGRHLVLVDERTEVLAPDSLAHLSAALDRPGVGMAGPLVVAEDDTIWDAGSHLVKGRLEHPWRGLPHDAATIPELVVDRDVDVLDPACVALDVDAFRAVGGWSEEVPSHLAHVDLALKIRREGLTSRWCHASAFWTFGPPPRRPSSWEVDFVRRRWGRILAGRTA